MLKRDPILISLSPTSLRVGVVHGGEVVRSERVCIATSMEETWVTGLRSLDDALRETLQTLHVKPGTPAAILYYSPRSVAEVFQVPASGTAAQQAVKLYLTQNLPNSGEGWLTQHQLISDDSKESSHTQAPTPGTQSRQTTALTYADSSQDADTLALFIRRSGLDVSGVMPAKAALLRNALQNPPERDEDRPNVFLHVGEHAMTLTAWKGNKLLLARQAEVGYSLLVDAVLRAAASALKSDACTREFAIRTLFSSGLPLPGEMIDNSLGLSADTVLPSIQPAMQRYVIEVRQTLRFGMLESDVSRARVILTGPGAAIPTFAEMLSDMLEIDIQRDENLGNGTSDELVGNLVIAKWLLGSSGWILPPSVQVARTSRQTLQAVRYGAVAAAALLAVLAGRAYSGAGSLKSAIAELQPKASEIDTRLAARAQATKSAQSMEQINSLISAGLGTRTDWRAVLASLSSLMPSGMELEEVTGDYTSAEVMGSPAMLLRGLAPEVGANGASPTSEFIEALTNSPLVLSARVTNSRNNEVTGQREFTISVQLRGVQVAGPITAPIEVEENTTSPASASEDQQP